MLKFQSAPKFFIFGRSEHQEFLRQLCAPSALVRDSLYKICTMPSGKNFCCWYQEWDVDPLCPTSHQVVDYLEPG